MRVVLGVENVDKMAGFSAKPSGWAIFPSTAEPRIYIDIVKSLESIRCFVSARTSGITRVKD